MEDVGGGVEVEELEAVIGETKVLLVASLEMMEAIAPVLSGGDGGT